MSIPSLDNDQPIPVTVLEAQPELVATLSVEGRAIALRVTRSFLAELGDWSDLEALGDQTVARLRVLEAHLVRLIPLVDRTLGVWQRRSAKALTHEDAREMVENVVGFFQVLAGWANPQR